MTIEELKAERDKLIKRMAGGLSDAQSGTDRLAYQPTEQQRIALQTLDSEIAKLEGSQGRLFTITTCRGI